MQGVLDRNPGLAVPMEFNAARIAEPRELPAEEALQRGEDTMLVLSRAG